MLVSVVISAASDNFNRHQASADLLWCWAIFSSYSHISNFTSTVSLVIQWWKLSF